MNSAKINAANPRCLVNEGIDGEKMESNAPKCKNSTDSAGSANGKYQIVAEIADGPRLRLSGRDAWCLRELVQAGERGCTPIDNPAPRFAAYVHKLRKAGFYIETIHERHSGPFQGLHARYKIRSSVTIIEESGAAA